MSDSLQQNFLFFASQGDDEYDEDIDSYDNERYNVYDDGIGSFNSAPSEDMDDEDDDPIEDDTLPLFDSLDEHDEYDDLEED